MAFFAAPLAAAGGKAAGSLLGSLFNAHPKDKVRLARNADMYRRAKAGDRIAWYHLGVLSRRVAAPVTFTFGPYDDGWTGTVQKGAAWNGSTNGWATKLAADDAWDKYQSAAAAFSTQTGGGILGLTIPGVPGIGNGVENNGNLDNGTGVVPGIFTASAGGSSLLTYMVGGGIVYLLFKAVSKGR